MPDRIGRIKLNHSPEIVEVELTEPRKISMRRYAFVDLLRGTALLIMIETHVLNAYLPFESRNTLIFSCLSFVNGLVAPAFLYAAGFSLVLQARARWGEWLRMGRPFWINVRRLGFIALVGYFLHLQRYRLSRYLRADEPGIWEKTFQVDILQCIVASLLILQILIFVVRKRAVFAWSAGFLAAVVALMTPWVWEQDFTDRLPLPLALFLNPHGISLFPLFPWLSFVLAGSVAAHSFLNSVERIYEIRHMRNVLLTGIIMIAGSLAAWAAPFALPGDNNFYETSPLYLLIRLGCVLALATLLYGMEKFLHIIPSWIQTAGQQSLLVYGVHLWVIFAILRGKHLGPVIGLEHGYMFCFLVSAALMVFMVWLAGGWKRLIQEHRTNTKRAQAVIVTLLVLAFLLT